MNATTENQPHNIVVDKFADIELLRYEVSGFDDLSLKQKKLLYYLSQAAIEGRDILYDQNCRYNMIVRRTLEAIYTHFNGDINSKDYQDFVVYLKRVWFANGIHHHYGEEKFVPAFSQSFFESAIKALDDTQVPLQKGQTKDELLNELIPVIFDPTVLAKRTNQAEGDDLIVTSANNYYGEGITQTEAEAFYAKMRDPNDSHPVLYGLNSRLIKENGQMKELTWKIGGLYSTPLEKIVEWLTKAATVAENEKQKTVIETLINYYRTGDLREFDRYAILWVEDLASHIDFVNGFTESYGDPLGLKASWEAIVNFKNITASRRTEVISANAQWFEDHSPVDPRFRKEKVKGVSAKVITAAMLGGDCYPATPIGINLPNSDWIRKEYGSKSVTIENITEAYDKAAIGSGFAEEFYWSAEECALIEQYGFTTDNLHTDLHECLGHGSGKLLPGVSPDALKAYGSTIEEARADLFSLYYMADPMMVELELLPNGEAYKAEYYRYLCNGLMTQLTRIEPSKNIEEAHMRNRALVAHWVFEHGKNNNVVEMKQRNGKTFVVINDYAALRTLFGQLLAEIQRIKSEGDFETAKRMVEDYGVKVDASLHNEILTRYKRLNIAPFKGFVNPVYQVETDAAGSITDITIDYNEGYVEQMLRYSKEHSWL